MQASILNDVIGPIMRGPSSSHTAGAYRIARLACDLAGETPARIRITFDPDGSYAPTFIALGVDKAFAAGVLGWKMTDARYPEALDTIARTGTELVFSEEPLQHGNHPNSMRIQMDSAGGNCLEVWAKSTGGGIVELTRVDDQEVSIDGRSWTLLVASPTDSRNDIGNCFSNFHAQIADNPERAFLKIDIDMPPTEALLESVRALPQVGRILSAGPVLLPQPGTALFSSAAEMLGIAEADRLSIASLALRYEAQLLGTTEEACRAEMAKRVEVMLRSVSEGMMKDKVNMPLLNSTAAGILEADRSGVLPMGGILTRSSARAMAAMHICNSKGVVCAAPTGGAAGVLAGVLATMAEEMDVTNDRLVNAAFVAGGIGLIMAQRATFAAEEAGCQVEIGFASAMATAAIVETFGGTPGQSLHGAAITLQNTSGIVCDPVDGGCEIPCHTRNAVAAANSFLCADLVMGGYANPISLDESIDASYAAGKALPPELRCTARGGLAITTSARRLIALKR